jgi:hypothetical protein
MRGHKGYTIYKSGSCDLRPGHTVKECNQDRARIGPGLGRAGAGPRLGQIITVIDGMSRRRRNI